MEHDFITIRELLGIMDSDQFFSLTYVKANRKKGTGGGMVHVAKAKKCAHKVKEGKKLTAATIQHATKSPNHSTHFTRNIVVFPGLEVRKVHIDLITHFNGKEVS